MQTFAHRCIRYCLLFTCFALLAVAPLSWSQAQEGIQGQESIQIDANAPTTPFPHFWEQMFGSGRANLMLREDYREDLRAVHATTGFRYVRAHGILDDENGV